MRILFTVVLLIGLVFTFCLATAQEESKHEGEMQHQGEMQHEEGMEHEHEEGMEHQHEGEEHAEIHGAMPANTVMSGDVAFLIEPLIDISGQTKLAITLSENGKPVVSTAGFIIISPKGNVTSVSTSSGTALADLGMFESGEYFVTGAVMGRDGLHRTSFTLLADRKVTELDTDVMSVLAPAPKSENSGRVEAFVYAFSGGEIVHRLFTVSAAPAGEHLHAEDGATLVHEHFKEVYTTDTFAPAANRTTLSLDELGSWNILVTISGGFTESATFEVEVP